MPSKLFLGTVLRKRVCLDFALFASGAVRVKWLITFCACVFCESGGWLLLQKLNHITIARETRWTIVTLQIESINNNSFHLGRNFLTVIDMLTSATVRYRPQNWRIYTSESLKYRSKTCFWGRQNASTQPSDSTFLPDVYSWQVVQQDIIWYVHRNQLGPYLFF